MEGKPIYYNNVTVCEITKRGKKIIEKDLFSMELPTTSTTIDEFMSNENDLSYIASRCLGKTKQQIQEKINNFKENFRVKRIDTGKIIGYQSHEKPIDPDEYL